MQHFDFRGSHRVTMDPPGSAQSQDMSAGCGDSDTGSSCAIPSHRCSIADLHGSAWSIGKSLQFCFN
ncbi:hypothetical protein AV530_000777 [Patagioenas fasciata monilis]|uniref:Uncharacterized protein n=1 Tax=Patagioenas fasciata monilis TaxID=372326 RepID=A0A1V4KS74_PATFA|nr:hypothetical protein AV530_000777 [Patagioenas fasciata monilis]